MKLSPAGKLRNIANRKGASDFIYALSHSLDICIYFLRGLIASVLLRRNIQKDDAWTTTTMATFL